MNPNLRKGLRDRYLAPFLAVIFVMFSFGALGQYNPGIHVVVNDAVAPAQPVPLDARTQYWDAISFHYRPFVSAAEAKSYLATTASRSGNAIIVVDSGGILQPNGTYSGGTNNFWMFKDGTADGNLVEMNLFGSGSGCSGCLLAANNLSDLNSIATAKVNLSINNVDNTSDATKWISTKTLTNTTMSGL